MGIATAKETDMKRALRFAVVALALVAAYLLSGCTDDATRNTLTVVSVNDGNTFFSDLINTADSTKPYIPVDEVAVTFGNIPNGGGQPLAPDAPYARIVVTGYTVTYQNGVYSPVSGGLNVEVLSGETADGTITLNNSGEKAALLSTLGGTVTTTANIHFTGYNYVNGYNNGEPLWADAAITVQVGDFGDE
jgi:hypothetical protein